MIPDKPGILAVTSLLYHILFQIASEIALNLYISHRFYLLFKTMEELHKLCRDLRLLSVM